MKVLTNTSWMVHGESGWPLWILVPMLAVVVFFVLRWLRAERRRPGVAASLLPVTGTLFCLLCGWLIWRPVLVRVQEWRHQAKSLVYVDRSASMQTPLHNGDLTDALDLLATWQPEALPEDRVHSPRDLAAALGRAVTAADELRAAFEKARAETEQGLPQGAWAADTMAGFKRWTQELAAEVFPLVAALEQLPVPPPDADSQDDLAAWITTLSSNMNQLTQMAPAATLEQGPDIGRALTALTATIATGLPTLKARQLVLDTELCEARKPLAQAVAELAKVTRQDAASRIAPTLGAEELPAGSQANPDETDIYQGITRLLDANQDAVVSDCFVLSDGGHNALNDATVAKRLKRSGVRLRAIGVGSISPVQDYAIVDWQAPGLIKTGTELKVLTRVKVPVQGAGPVSVVLSEADNVLASIPVSPAESRIATVVLKVRAPPVGHHALTLAVAVEDANPANNRAVFAVDVVKTTPRALMIGDLPNWDTAYLDIAMRRVGLDEQQLFHGVTDEAPARGGSSRSIPRSLSQWGRNRLVVFAGAAFAGLTADDLGILGKYVTEEGGTIILLVGESLDYLTKLAPIFGWEDGGDSLVDTRIRLSRTAYHLPLMRVGVDGPSSARGLAGLGHSEAAFRVPAQHLALLENADGQALLTVGFYGRGRVYLCGLSGLSGLAGFGKAPLLDRFLSQWISDAARPLFADADQVVACYPAIPVANQPNRILVTGDGAVARQQGDQTSPLDLADGVENRWAELTPVGQDHLRLASGGKLIVLPVSDNPGMEQIYHEFDPGFLKAFAEDADGTYHALSEARNAVAAIEPTYWTSQTAARYALADHWLLLALAIATGTLHWVLRKLSGLAI